MIDSERVSRRILLVAVAALVSTALLVALLVVVLVHRNQTQLPKVAAVVSTDRIVPDQIAKLPLVDEHGRPTDLLALHGKTIVLADFMTSCQEICPITTGALLEVEQRLVAAHLTNQVEIVEVSIDPGRDTPARLLAYQQTFGVHWTVLTGSQANLGRLWSWFGVFVERVAEGKPPGINWQTGRPYTYDIVHSDDVFILDTKGNERAVAAGNPNVAGVLPKRLAGLLDAQGHQNLSNPGFGSWTPVDMIDAIGTVLGQSISTATSG